MVNFSHLDMKAPLLPIEWPIVALQTVGVDAREHFKERQHRKENTEY